MAEMTLNKLGVLCLAITYLTLKAYSITFIYRFKKKEYLLLSFDQRTLNVMRSNRD